MRDMKVFVSQPFGESVVSEPLQESLEDRFRIVYVSSTLPFIAHDHTVYANRVHVVLPHEPGRVINPSFPLHGFVI